MRVKRMTVIAVAAALALAAAGCGGGSSSGASPKTSASSYVHTLCNAISGFEKSVTAGQANLKKLSMSAHPDLGKLRSQVTQFFTSESQAATQARSQISAAGTPNVTGGPRIRAALVGAFQRFSDGFATAAQQSKSLNTKSEKQFTAAVQQLETQLQKTSQGVSSSLNGLGTSLKDAASEDSTCTSIA